MSCGNTWIVDMGLMPGKPSILVKGKQRLMRENYRCIADNEGRKQRAVQSQWNSSCEFLNTNLLHLQQKVLKNLIRGLCCRKTLYKSCHYCFCRENYFAYTEIEQNEKFLLLCSVLRTKSYSEKQQNNKYPLCCSVSASRHVWLWLLKKTFPETLFVLERLGTSIFFTQLLHSFCVFF